MVTIISGTNRKNSHSLLLSRYFANELSSLGIDNQIYSLDQLPAGFINQDMYEEPSAEARQLAELLIKPSRILVFVIPEYNGGFPGILKTFIDGLSPSDFRDKKAVLIGLSSGRAGSLRGMDQFTNVLHYLRVHVHYSKPKLSGFNQLIDNQGNIINEEANRLIKHQAQIVKDWL